MLRGKMAKVVAQLGSVLLFVVALASDALAQNLTVTLLQKGTSGTLVGVPDVEVARHNPATGAFLESRTTDVNGLADFGNVGSARTTISIIVPDSTEGSVTFKDTVALVNVPTGNIKVRADDDLDEEASEPVLATFNVALTNIPVNTSTSMNLSNGKYFDGGPTGQFNGITVGPQNLDASGRFNLVAEARDLTNVLACGSALDLDPATVNGTTIIVSLNAAPIQIPFTTIPSTPVKVGHNVEYLRNSATIEGGHGHPGSVKLHASGNLITCPVSGFEKVQIRTEDAHDGALVQKGVSRTFTALPASIDFTLPNRSITTLSRSGSTVNWTTSGTAVADITVMEMEWASGANTFHWAVISDPTVTSVTLPTLPGAYSDRNAVPPSGVAVIVEQAGLDSVTGFDDLVAAVSAAEGSIEALFFNATDSFWISRNLGQKESDFDGDGKSDIGIYRDGAWYIIRSSDAGITTVGWGGAPQDVPVPADYDGDGKTDIAVYRDGAWFIIRSSDGGITVVGWGGSPQDVPAPADYDGDGKTDIAVYRDGAWFIIRSSDGGITVVGWGGAVQDRPVPADYDGDGKSDIGIYRDGAWYIIRSSDAGITTVGWGGAPQDVPVPADYDGDGKTDIAVYRDGAWFIIRSSDGGITVVGWGGAPQDVPVPADYDGDGKTDVAVYRDGVWFIVRSSDGGITTVGWGGAPQDIPLN